MSLFGKKHSGLKGSDVGSIVRWEVADEAARLALVVAERDTDAVCKQLDGPTYWVLVEYAGPTWKQIDLQGGTVALEILNSGATITPAVESIDFDEGLDVSVVGNAVTVGVTGAVTSVTVPSGVQTGDVDITAADLGLGNVDDTADADKPVSTAQGIAIGAASDAAAADAPPLD